ncbi:MAG: ABC transporter substrate-binding protein [Bacillota bacterium]|nr:ABC transporter substrate-binding protein [Bacillota bacterium]
MVFSLILSMLCVGCGNKQKVGTASQQTEAQKIIVTDDSGRQVEIPDKVERIVVNYGIAGHMVFALGQQDKLVGIDSPSKDNAFFNAIKPGFSSLPTPGNPSEVNIEEVITLNPDLIIVPGRNKELIENLEQRGLTVFGVTAEDLEQLKITMKNLGKALGNEEKAAQFIKYYDDAIKTVQEKTKDLQPNEKPGVYLVGRDGLLSTCSEDMYQHFLIDLVGGKNVAAEESIPGQGWFKISPEQLIKWNPDLIVVARYASGITPQQILTDERLRGINAVKNKQVFWFPSELGSWDCPSPQAVPGIKWLAKKLHPNKFQDMNLEKDVDDFFMMLYGKTFTDLGGSL